MQNRDAFSSLHPIVNFLYFGLVLTFSMCFMHPICLGVSFMSSISYNLCLRGHKTARFSLLSMLPMMLLAALINFVFNHEGETILCYLASGNPLTLESIAYGGAAAVMLGAVLFWFSCYNEVMTSDKFIYLFGRIIPALSLVLSMTLRFVPKFGAQLRVVSDAQRCTGQGALGKSLRWRVQRAVTILSVMLTWSLENAVETADSMKSRGYGLPGRTAFSVYRFDDRDKWVLIWIIFCGVFILSGWIAGGVYFRYYPSIKGVAVTAFSLSFMLAYLALCLTPIILNIKEGRAWKHSQLTA